MLKLILIVIVVAIVAVLVLAATRPDAFRVERSAAIKAPPEKIFPLINDFHNWAAWSPWEKIDPALKRTFGGAPAGKGTMYAWEGNSKVGSGSMEITESSPPGKIVIKLDFIKPFEGHNIAEFTLVPGRRFHDGHLGHVRPGALHGEDHAPVLQYGQMVGGSFEEGLANLKAAAEAAK